MRYYHEKPEIYTSMYGECYICNHPVYNRCTLFKIDDKGIFNFAKIAMCIMKPIIRR